MTRRQQFGYMFAAMMMVPWLAYLLYNPMWFVAKLIVAIPLACVWLLWAGREYRRGVLAKHQRLDRDAERQHAALTRGDNMYGIYGAYLPDESVVPHVAYEPPDGFIEIHCKDRRCSLEHHVAYVRDPNGSR